MIRARRVLALVTDAFGGGGGIAQYNRDYLTALAQSGAVGDIDILPRQQQRPVSDLPQGAHQRAPIQNQIVYSLRALQLALCRPPAVVFCGHLYMAPLAALIAALTGAKLAIQAHGIEVWLRPNATQRVAVEKADQVLCVSRDTRARILTWAAIAPERVVVLPNTVSEVYSPGDGSAFRESLGIQEKTVLLSISRLDASQQYKGQDRVIRLIAPLRARGHDLMFIIGGKGDDRIRLQSLAEAEGVAEHVRFLGEVAYSQLPDLYRAADLYLMPSAGEGFGIVFLEAMACGTPALGLALGGATDALSDGVAVSESDLLEATTASLTGNRPEPVHLWSKVAARFGRPVFQERTAQLINRLLTEDSEMAA